MSVPTALKNRDQRGDDQWQGDKGEQDMRNQDWKINPGDHAGVARGKFAEFRVINDVADEKPGRGDERDDHAGNMALPDIAPDPEPAG